MMRRISAGRRRKGDVSAGVDSGSRRSELSIGMLGVFESGGGSFRRVLESSCTIFISAYMVI